MYLEGTLNFNIQCFVELKEYMGWAENIGKTLM